VRTAHSGDTVFIKRKKARAYAYGAPSTTAIRKKKRYVTYHEPSSVVVHRRHAGLAVEGGASTRTSTRTSVRTQSGGTAVRSSGLSQTVGGGKNIRERSSGQGNIGASSSPAGPAGRGAGWPDHRPLRHLRRRRRPDAREPLARCRRLARLTVSEVSSAGETGHAFHRGDPALGDRSPGRGLLWNPAQPDRHRLTTWLVMRNGLLAIRVLR
jgi:hypothetical protein